MQFQGVGAAHGVEAEDEVDVGQEVAGGVHVEVLLQPPLGAGKVDLASTGEEEGDGVSRVGSRGGVEGRQESGNLKERGFQGLVIQFQQLVAAMILRIWRNLTSRSMETPEPLLSAPVARLETQILREGLFIKRHVGTAMA